MGVDAEAVVAVVWVRADRARIASRWIVGELARIDDGVWRHVRLRPIRLRPVGVRAAVAEADVERDSAAVAGVVEAATTAPFVGIASAGDEHG